MPNDIAENELPQAPEQEDDTQDETQGDTDIDELVSKFLNELQFRLADFDKRLRGLEEQAGISTEEAKKNHKDLSSKFDSLKADIEKALYEEDKTDA